eukprot:1362521-Amorphochlora_amoeboformis.AAC.1
MRSAVVALSKTVTLSGGVNGPRALRHAEYSVPNPNPNPNRNANPNPNPNANPNPNRDLNKPLHSWKRRKK